MSNKTPCIFCMESKGNMYYSKVLDYYFHKECFLQKKKEHEENEDIFDIDIDILQKEFGDQLQ